MNPRKYPNFSNISEMNRQRRRQKGRSVNEDSRRNEPSTEIRDLVRLASDNKLCRTGGALN